MRIIPAYAGSTDERLHGDLPFLGSSPHTRGARRRRSPPRPAEGIIPAYAGSTAFCGVAPIIRPDHPRIRGEHEPDAVRLVGSSGSSPHTRGAPRPTVGGAGDRRIIPAYAGSTFAVRRPRWKARDHPRIRGEHMTRPPGSIKHRGSSPHTRGARGCGRAHPREMRIIPAYAGSTDAGEAAGQALSDHPRIRGEHTPHPKRPSQTTGSSPHTRGAQAGHSLAASDARIIPAYAGSTRKYQQDKAWRSDHPRIRGEHASPPRMGRFRRGSSPHTRGARRWRYRR